MANLLTRKTSQSLSAYFVLTWFTAVLPSMAIAIVTFMLSIAPHVENVARYTGTDLPFWRQIFENAIIIPLIESVILIFPTAVAGSALTNRGAAAAIGALPVSLMHLVVGWTKPLIVFWFFFVFAYAYLELRTARLPVRAAFLFVVLGHALGNLLLTLSSRLVS